MIVTVASYKGGVGKTTTAVHLAAYLHRLDHNNKLDTRMPSLLLDGDSTRNATAWGQRGDGFPFQVAPIAAAAKLAQQYRHVVIDTGQRPSDEDLQAAVEGCDLLVIPTVPSALDTDGLGQTLRALQKLGATNYRVLLTRVSPDMAGAALELRKLLRAMKAPVFQAEIPRLKAFEYAARYGLTVDQALDRQAARAWEAYAAVGRELSVVSGQGSGKAKR